LFHDLEGAWSQGDEDSKVVALRELFSQIADLELHLKQKNHEMGKMRVRHVCAAAPALHRIRLTRAARIPRTAFAAWRLLACRASCHHISGSNAEVAAKIAAVLGHERLPEAVCMFFDARQLFFICRKYLCAWYLRARGMKGLNQLGQICVKQVIAQDCMQDQMDLISAFTDWRRWTKQQPHKRWNKSASHVEEELKQRVQRHMEEIEGIRYTAEDLARQNEAMGQEVTQTQEAIGLWLTACGATPDSPEYPLGLAARAANQRQLSTVHRQRAELQHEVEEVSVDIQPLMERMNVATKSADKIRWHIENRSGSSASQEHHEQQLIAAQRSQDSLQREISMLQAKQARLQEKLNQADAALQDSTLHAEESLQMDLHDAQKYVEKVLNSLRLQVRELRDKSRMEASENERLRALLDGERTRWLAQTESDRNLWMTELKVAQAQSHTLEQQMNEAKLWVDHLRHQSSQQASRIRMLRSQEMEIVEMKNALSDLADINVEVVQSRGRSLHPGMYPRSTEASPDNHLMSRPATIAPRILT